MRNWEGLERLNFDKWVQNSRVNKNWVLRINRKSDGEKIENSEWTRKRKR